MKRRPFLFFAVLIITTQSFAAESHSGNRIISYMKNLLSSMRLFSQTRSNLAPELIFALMNLPRELQKEVLNKITSPALMQKIAISSQDMRDLVQEMKTKRELNLAVLWLFKDALRSRALIGHTDRVTAVALSPDKQIALTGSSDTTAKIWDVETGKLIRTLPHTHSVIAVALSNDKKIALTGSYDYASRIWNVVTGEMMQMLYHSGPVCSIALSCDNQIALAGSWDNTAKIWNVSTGELIHCLAGHDWMLYSVALSPDKRIAITASMDNTAKVWNVSTGDLIQTLSSSTSVRAVAVSPDNKFVFTGILGTVDVWDISSGKKIKTLTPDLKLINSLTVTSDFRLIIVGQFEQSLVIVDSETGNTIQILEDTQPIHSAAVSPDNLMIITGSGKNGVTLWTVKPGNE